MRKLKREKQRKEEMERVNIEKDKVLKPDMPAYQPLLARRSDTGDYGIIFNGQLYVLPKEDYQVMRTSINQRKGLFEIRAINCYRCHQKHVSSKIVCDSHIIPTCRGCGRLVRNEKECPTPFFRHLKEYGQPPSISLTCPYLI